VISPAASARACSAVTIRRQESIAGAIAGRCDGRGVGDHDVETRPGLDAIGEGANLVECREIGALGAQACAGYLLCDVRPRGGEPLAGA
jgi:hypothetical protein